MKKGNITGGLILILIGAWFLAVQFIPQLDAWASDSWPLIIIGIAAVFLLVSILNDLAGLSIPAFIIGGIGGLLYYQNATGDWNSWAYAWTLIPGFVGLGLLFFSLQAKDKGAMSAGIILFFITSILFFVFGSFLGAPKQVIQFWPLLLILTGLWSMIRSFFGSKKAKTINTAQPVETITFAEEEIIGENNEN